MDRNPQQTTNTRPGSGRDRPTGTIGTNNTATREVRPTRESQTARPTSPTREVRPTRDIQTVRPTTPTREVRPTQNITPTRPTRDVQTRPTREMQTRPAQSTQQTRPSYNTTPSRSSMGLWHDGWWISWRKHRNVEWFKRRKWKKIILI